MTLRYTLYVEQNKTKNPVFSEGAKVMEYMLFGPDFTHAQKIVISFHFEAEDFVRHCDSSSSILA